MYSLRIILGYVLLLLVACSNPIESGFNGAWKSDREKTLAELEKIEGWSSDQKNFIWNKIPFGKPIIIIEDGVPIGSIYEGQCEGPGEQFELVEKTDTTVVYTYYNEFLAEEVTGKAEIRGNDLFVSVPILEQTVGQSVYEVFSRVSLNDVLEKYPCAKEF